MKVRVNYYLYKIYLVCHISPPCKRKTCSLNVKNIFSAGSFAMENDDFITLFYYTWNHIFKFQLFRVIRNWHKWVIHQIREHVCFWAMSKSCASTGIKNIKQAIWSLKLLTRGIHLKCNFTNFWNFFILIVIGQTPRLETNTRNDMWADFVIQNSGHSGFKFYMQNYVSPLLIQIRLRHTMPKRKR